MSDVENTQDLESDGEADCEGYFLEPSACSTSIGERIAEANRQLFENTEEEASEGDDRPRKVQFCENLVDFASENAEYTTEEEESTSNHSEEEFVNNENIEETEIEEQQEPSEPNLVLYETVGDYGLDEEDVISPDIKPNSEEPEKHEEKDQEEDENGSSSRLLLVLLPREQSSSCESIIGEDCAEQEDEEEDTKGEEEEAKELKEKIDQKMRPKSANKGIKCKRSQEKVHCKMVTISPELNCSFENDSKGWHESQNVRLRPKSKAADLKTSSRDYKRVNVVEVEGVLKERPSSSNDVGRTKALPVIRPKTAPSKRPCCIVRSDLPRYNGLRSEYGLSAEQLQERKQRNAVIRQQLRAEKQSKQQEELQKRLDNEVKFSSWLEEKAVRTRSGSNSNNVYRKNDTLVRSDVFIQKNAVYASKCGVAYAVDYAFGRSKSKVSDIRKKTLDLGKLFETISPHAQRTFQIYVDTKP